MQYLITGIIFGVLNIALVCLLMLITGSWTAYECYNWSKDKGKLIGGSFLYFLIVPLLFVGPLWLIVNYADDFVNWVFIVISSFIVGIVWGAIVTKIFGVSFIYYSHHRGCTPITSFSTGLCSMISFSLWGIWMIYKRDIVDDIQPTDIPSKQEIESKYLESSGVSAIPEVKSFTAFLKSSSEEPHIGDLGVDRRYEEKLHVLKIPIGDAKTANLQVRKVFYITLNQILDGPEVTEFMRSLGEELDSTDIDSFVATYSKQPYEREIREDSTVAKVIAGFIPTSRADTVHIVCGIRLTIYEHDNPQAKNQLMAKLNYDLKRNLVAEAKRKVPEIF